MAENTNGLKQYHLSTEELELMLQTQYGGNIQPVDHEKLQKLRKQQQRQAAMKILLKSKRIDPEEESPEVEDLKEIESL
ncbi:MAG: hypothetical protein ABFC57_03330 [Veillonellales bacterium]